MRVADVSELPEERERAVIINVGTELVTTLALLAALRHASMPVLVLNCDPTEESREHFDSLMRRWDFDVADAPLRKHGHALDVLFGSIRAELVLLIDSDVEILDSQAVERMREAFDHPRTFGAGFVEEAGWMQERFRAARRTGMSHERPWMPLVMLRSEMVRKALASSLSFLGKTDFNDVRFSARLSRLLAARLIGDPRAPVYPWLGRLPLRCQERLRTSRLEWLRWARREFYGERPSYVFSDTGAQIYQWCRYRKGWFFDGRPAALAKRHAHHYGAVTQRALRHGQHAAFDAIEDGVRARLRDAYGVNWETLSDMAHSGVATARLGHPKSSPNLLRDRGSHFELPP